MDTYSSSDPRVATIAALNDEFRQTLVGGIKSFTPGVFALGMDTVAAILQRVRTFDAFTQENDPYGEHDFGAFTFEGQTITRVASHPFALTHSSFAQVVSFGLAFLFFISPLAPVLAQEATTAPAEQSPLSTASSEDQSTQTTDSGSTLESNTAPTEDAEPSATDATSATPRQRSHPLRSSRAC